MSVNIYDVARKAGVSSATVSRVLNGRPHVREVTKKRVMDIINEMNYTPNALARKLSTGNTLNIGFLIPDIENPFFSSAEGPDERGGAVWLQYLSLWDR